MKAFLQRFGSKITGILSGFDRLRIRGTKRWLAHEGGMWTFLTRAGVLLKDFDAYVQRQSQTLCRAMEQAADGAGRPVVYLTSPQFVTSYDSFEMPTATVSFSAQISGCL